VEDASYDVGFVVARVEQLSEDSTVEAWSLCGWAQLAETLEPETAQARASDG
jgi:hypothetical protein